MMHSTNGYFSTRPAMTFAGVAILAGLAYVAYKGLHIGKKQRRR